MRRRLVLVAVAGLLAVPAGAAHAGGGGGGSICAGFAEGSAVAMFDSCFSGVAHFAPAGTLTVTNEGGLPHTFTAVDGSFDSGVLESGARFEVELAPGVHHVFCTLHGSAGGDGMAGVVLVGDPTPEQLAAASLVAAPLDAIGRQVEGIQAQTDRLAGELAEQTGLLATLSGRHERLVTRLERDPAPARAERELAPAGPAPATPTVVVVPGEAFPWSTAMVVLGMAAVATAGWVGTHSQGRGATRRQQPVVAPDGA